MNVVKSAKMATALGFATKESYELFLEKHPNIVPKMVELQKQKYAQYYLELVTDLTGMVQREFEDSSIDMMRFQDFYRNTDRVKKLVNDAPYSSAVDSDRMDIVCDDLNKRLNF
jgi:hypothetical protein